MLLQFKREHILIFVSDGFYEFQILGTWIIDFLQFDFSFQFRINNEMILNKVRILINRRKNLKIHGVKSTENFLPGTHLQVHFHLLLVSLFLSLFFYSCSVLFAGFHLFSKLEVSSKSISNLQQIQGNFIYDSLEFEHSLTLLSFIRKPNRNLKSIGRFILEHFILLILQNPYISDVPFRSFFDKMTLPILWCSHNSPPDMKFKSCS